MAALTVSAAKPSETISFSQRTRETSSGMLHAGSGSHHFSFASLETETRDARGFSRGRFTCGKKKQKKKAKTGEAIFWVESFKKIKVKIAKKGYLTWEDTYTNASERKTTGIGAYRGGARDYYSSGTSYKHGKAYKNEYVQQFLVRRGRNGQLSGHVACAFGASDRMALNGVLTARDGKRVYKTKMKHGTFDFGIIKAGYYRICGEGRYKGKKVRYYGEKSVVPAFDEITAWVSGGHGFRTF